MKETRGRDNKSVNNPQRIFAWNPHHFINITLYLKAFLSQMYINFVFTPHLWKGAEVVKGQRISSHAEYRIKTDQADKFFFFLSKRSLKITK